MIDLEEIKRHRALWTPDDSTSLPTIGAHVDALVEEVERLRDEAELLRTGRDVTRDYADRVEAEVLALRGEVERERAAVVAWLRQRRYPDAFIHAPWVADAIERGEHRRKEER